MRLIRGDDVIIRMILLQHEPHRFDIFFGVTPVALCIQIAEIKFVLQPGLDVRHGARDFARDKRFAAPRAFVIEQNAAAREQDRTTSR